MKVRKINSSGNVVFYERQTSVLIRQCERIANEAKGLTGRSYPFSELPRSHGFITYND